MALHEVNIDSVKSEAKYIMDMINEFIASDMSAAEIDIPEGRDPKLFRAHMWQTAKRHGMLEDKSLHIKIKEDKVYLVKM